MRDVSRSGLPGSAGEFNWSGAYSTLFWVDPKEELAVVVMAQYLPAKAWPLRKELKQLVYDAMSRN